MSYVYFIIFTCFGFFVAKFFSGKKEGQEGHLESLKFRIGSHILHIHHWLYGSIILLLLWFIGFYNDIVFGFFTGLVLQGLTYRDFYFVYYTEEQYRKKFPL
jgi:hypothetical protein